jgi:hypothetical protein
VFLLAVGPNKKQPKASVVSDLNRWFLPRRGFDCFYFAYLGCQDARINPNALSQLSIAVAPDSVESMTISGTWARTQSLMAVSQATSDQKEGDTSYFLSSSFS